MTPTRLFSSKQRIYELEILYSVLGRKAVLAKGRLKQNLEQKDRKFSLNVGTCMNFKQDDSSTRKREFQRASANR